MAVEVGGQGWGLRGRDFGFWVKSEGVRVQGLEFRDSG